jgi:hypothetical protein
VVVGQVLGLIAAIPALGLAFLAQRVLADFTDIIKRLSGWGLFVFAMIFLIKGFKLRAAAKAAPIAPRAAAPITPPANAADVSLEVADSPKTGAGFTVGTPAERSKGEVEGLTGELTAEPVRAPPLLLPLTRCHTTALHAPQYRSFLACRRVDRVIPSSLQPMASQAQGYLAYHMMLVTVLVNVGILTQLPVAVLLCVGPPAFIAAAV